MKEVKTRKVNNGYDEIPQRKEKEMTHEEICKLLDVPRSKAPYSLKPLWAVQKTKIEIYVEGKRNKVFGGAIICGQCGYGINGILGSKSDKLLSSCPKCGCIEVKRTGKNPWEEKDSLCFTNNPKEG